MLGQGGGPRPGNAGKKKFGGQKKICGQKKKKKMAEIRKHSCDSCIGPM
jgi:hypothetical protein